MARTGGQLIGTNMVPSRTRLGKFIRARRIKLGFNQTKVAKLAGLGQSVLSRFEIGTRKYLNQKQLTRLAKALRCNPEELRKRNQPEKLPEEPQTELGRIIRARREEIGLTLEIFATRMGMNRWEARRLEVQKGLLRMSYIRARRLAKTLNLDVSVFSSFIGYDTTPIESNMGNLVRTHRKELAMSEKELAKKLGVTRQYVSQIELGLCPLRKNKVITRITRVLKIDPALLEAVRPRRRLCQKKREDPLGDFLTRRRLDLDLTQTQVAKRAQSSLTIVSDMERGKDFLRGSMLQRFSRALECEIPAGLVVRQQL